MLFSTTTPYVFITIGLIAVLTACTSSSTPVAKQVSPPATNTPLIKNKTVTPINTTTPTATTAPTITPTPTPKPSLEEVLLTGARHVQGVDDAPVTLIEFSDFK
jgi:protein-disulfide isomerase